jgi:hypothetical protein
MPKYFEILFCPMFSMGDEDRYLDPSDPDRGDKAPDFYDVEVLRHANDVSGEIDVVEYCEDLTREDAERIFEEMVGKYPLAQKTIMP